MPLGDLAPLVPGLGSTCQLYDLLGQPSGERAFVQGDAGGGLDVVLGGDQGFRLGFVVRIPYMSRVTYGVLDGDQDGPPNSQPTK